MNVGTLTGSRDHYIVVRVVEESSGKNVWQVVQRHRAGAEVPDYGNRALRFINWTADSTQVTVLMADGREMVLPVP